ncbi:hypothetical protein K0M31_004080 [Melipona bicolor]|uniref:Uncharacterized protein n=1 Tax=Melipona bicolor TaxID=60889 RepID=A0AA40FY50_9HYME|nr:hypothetical protein K0M31_004080 [Melipona bicolor]
MTAGTAVLLMVPVVCGLASLSILLRRGLTARRKLTRRETVGEFEEPYLERICGKEVDLEEQVRAGASQVRPEAERGRVLCFERVACSGCWWKVRWPCMGNATRSASEHRQRHFYQLVPMVLYGGGSTMNNDYADVESPM